MKLLIFADIHGKMPKIPKGIAYDAVLFVGDLGDDSKIRPLINKSFQLGVSWEELVRPAKKNKLLRELVASGKAMSKKLSSLKKTVYCIPGNWDMTLREISKKSKKNYEQTYLYKNMTNCDKKLIDVGPCCIIGYGNTSSPEYPQTKQAISQYTLSQIKKIVQRYVKTYTRMEKLMERAQKKQKPIILLTHNVPYKTPFDKIVTPAKKTIRVGSQIVKKLITLYQPKMVICGHIHETKGNRRMKQTLCINTGLQNIMLLDTETWTVTQL